MMRCVSSGKLGDFIHSLYVIKNRTSSSGCLYITDNQRYGGDHFHFDISRTYNDLLPIVKCQSYIQEFRILESHDQLGPRYTNLNEWRNSPLLFNTNWSTILESVYNIPRNPEPWLSMGHFKWEDQDKLISNQILEDPKFSDTIIIHRSSLPQRWTSNFPWENIVKNNKCVFLTSNPTEYNVFPYKEHLPMLHLESLSDIFQAIGSCKMFVGNQSSPFAIAHGLGKNRLVELCEPDKNSYKGEEDIYNNFFYIAQNENYTNNLNHYINI